MWGLPWKGMLDWLAPEPVPLWVFESDQAAASGARRSSCYRALAVSGAGSDAYLGS